MRRLRAVTSAKDDKPLPWRAHGADRSRIRISERDIVAENLRAMGMDPAHGQDPVEQAIIELVAETGKPCQFGEIVDRTRMIPSTVGSRVQRLMIEGRILRPTRGRYMPVVVDR